jgi:hypothetical protein
LTFNGLQGVISQKIELYITTAVRTSNPSCDRNIYNTPVLLTRVGLTGPLRGGMEIGPVPNMGPLPHAENHINSKFKY